MEKAQYREINVAVRVHAIGRPQQRGTGRLLDTLEEDRVERRGQFGLIGEYLDAEPVPDFQAELGGGSGLHGRIVFQVPQITELCGRCAGQWQDAQYCQNPPFTSCFHIS